MANTQPSPLSFQQRIAAIRAIFLAAMDEQDDFERLMARAMDYAKPYHTEADIRAALTTPLAAYLGYPIPR